MSESSNGAGGLEGQAALVTGASSGLDRALVAALARRGADVALVAGVERASAGAGGRESSLTVVRQGYSTSCLRPTEEGHREQLEVQENLRRLEWSEVVSFSRQPQSPAACLQPGSGLAVALPAP